MGIQLGNLLENNPLFLQLQLQSAEITLLKKTLKLQNKMNHCSNLPA